MNNVPWCSVDQKLRPNVAIVAVNSQLPNPNFCNSRKSGEFASPTNSKFMQITQPAERHDRQCPKSTCFRRNEKYFAEFRTFRLNAACINSKSSISAEQLHQIPRKDKALKTKATGSCKMLFNSPLILRRRSPETRRDIHQPDTLPFQLQQAVTVSRCIESIYLHCARCSLRSQNPDFVSIHRIQSMHFHQFPLPALQLPKRLPSCCGVERCVALPQCQ